MTRVTWDKNGERFFQTGIDRGMLYVGGGVGVPWIGLASVTESPAGGDATATFVDGQKVLNVANTESFAMKIESYGIPFAFGPCAGWVPISTGLYATEQPKTIFGFSYRTLIGNDVNGTSLGYKIHIVLNATAKNADFSRQTVGQNPAAELYSWDVTTVPVAIADRRATAHLIFDSTNLSSDNLTKIENLLYGTDTTDPVLPDAVTLFNLVDLYATLRIQDNGDGTWTAIGPDDVITMLDANTFQIAWDSAVVIDANTYKISSL